MAAVLRVLAKWGGGPQRWPQFPNATSYKFQLQQQSGSAGFCVLRSSIGVHIGSSCDPQLRNPNCNWGAPSRHSKESGICQPFSVGHLHPHEPDSLGHARGLKRTHLETPLFLVVLVPWCQGANAFTSPPQQLEQLTPEQGGLVMHEAQMWRRYVTSSGQALLQSLGHPTPAFAASELHLAAGSRVEAFNAGSIQHVLSTATIPPPGPS